MNKELLNRTIIAILLSVLPNLIACQMDLFALRNTAYEGFTVLDSKGNILHKLPLHAQPIFGGVIYSGIYTDAIKIPTSNGKYPVKYFDRFYIINIEGNVVAKLHPNTEWVYSWGEEINRVSLVDYPKEGEFRDTYINDLGESLFENEIFQDGDDFLNGYTAVRTELDADWKIINTEGEYVKNISEDFADGTSAVYNAFHRIWSYRTESKYEEWFVSLKGVNNQNLSELVKSETGIRIPTLLLSSPTNAKDISNFLLNEKRHLFLTTRDEDGRIVQRLFNKQMHSVKISTPDFEGNYSMLRNSGEFVFGRFNPKKGEEKDLFVIIELRSNEIVATSKNQILQVSSNAMIIKENEYYLLKNFEGKTLFSTQNSDFGMRTKVIVDQFEKNFNGLDRNEDSEIIIVRGYNGEYLPNTFGSLKKLKTLVLIECRELLDLSIDLSQFQKLKNIFIIRCNRLKHYKPKIEKLNKLETISNGLSVRYFKEKELDCK